MAKTKTFELTNEEASFIEGFRRGQIALNDEQWIKVTQKEREVIEIWRGGEYGALLVEFIEGEPKISRLILEFRHGHLTKRQSTLDLIPRLQESGLLTS